ncbi:hypothetical protein B0H14DRAFT_2813156 [Mycena olivaceomarginata]|nr:hypothetical protein B0H14DRAFT_2813156 [Mycena olivaceomarginata]
MLSFLERIPQDVLQHIALAGASSHCGPPVDLCSLLSTCRAIYEGLNIHSSPHLYAAIFKLRSFRRCRALRRCHRLDISLPELRQDLWTLLWIVAEEGLCPPLSEAYFPQFIVKLALYYLRVDMDVTSQRDIQSLVIWLLCLGVSRQDILSENPEVRSTLVTLLRPFVSTSESRVPHSTSQPPSIVFKPNPVAQARSVAPPALPHVGIEDPGDEVLRRYNVRIRPPRLPSPSNAAIILIFALKEAVPLQIPYHLPATRAIATAENRSGPTAEDYTAFQRAVTHPQTSATTTLNFVELDPWISDILAIPNFPSEERVRPAHLAASLTGVWEGSMMISCVSLGNPVPKTPILSDFLCRTPMQCEFQKFIPSEDLQHELVRDHVLVGRTLQNHEDAWGSGGFNFTGKVDDDGLVVFTRRPHGEFGEMSETWIFQGRLHYGSALVGTFRSSSGDSCGVHGIFSMSKRAAAMQ